MRHRRHEPILGRYQLLQLVNEALLGNIFDGSHGCVPSMLQCFERAEEEGFGEEDFSGEVAHHVQSFFGL